MRDISFYYGTEIIIARITPQGVLFMRPSIHTNFLPIDNLQLSKEGVEKEFPHLKGSPTWKEEAIVLFKNHIERLQTEEAIEKYIIEDLSKHGYIAKIRIKQGHRPEVINGRR